MSLWTAPRPLLLASQSRTRRELLANAGIPVVAVAPGVDERRIEASMGTVDSAVVALRLARAKAQAVSDARPDEFVLGADQVLDLSGRRFSKPADAIEAAAQLRELSGRTHQLLSAFCLMRGGEVLADHVAVASLTMRRLDPAFIDRYLAAAGPPVCDSVGAYQLEGLGIHLFECVEGDHTTILGLPLLPLLAALRRHGLLAS